MSRLPDNQSAVAFTYGPVVLSAGLGTAQMTTTAHALTLPATKPAGLQHTIKINAGTTINDWIANIKTNLVQSAGKAEFTLKNTDSNGKLTFTPHVSAVPLSVRHLLPIEWRRRRRRTGDCQLPAHWEQRGQWRGWNVRRNRRRRVRVRRSDSR